MNDLVVFVKKALQAAAIATLVATTSLTACGGGESAGAVGSAVTHDSASSTPANGG